MDNEFYVNAINGIMLSISRLRENERVLIKINTLQEQEEIARTKVVDLDSALEEKIKEKKELENLRLSAIGKTCQGLANAVTALLPCGNCYFSFSDNGSLALAWDREGQRVPYYGLSGGEKAIFDLALSSALLGPGENILVGEMAEVDSDNLRVFMEKISELKPNLQILIASWHCPAQIPEPWLCLEAERISA